MNTRELQAQLRYQLSRMGWNGLGGLALIILALVLLLSWLLPRAHELEQTRLRVEAYAQSHDRTARSPARAAMALDDDHVDAYVSVFPSERALPLLVGKVFAAAEHQGVALQAGEYAEIEDRQSPLRQQRLTFPVKGEMRRIIAFADDVLAAVPSAALQNLTVHREKIEDGVVEAKLSFVIYTQGGR